ncbi:MAG: PASTA domain-containing protein [bacterium]|nr:PASTA domain-containing protein [bacterium]
MANENTPTHWGKLFFSFLGIIIFAVFLGFFIAGAIISQKKKVEIPDVAGQSVVDALEALNPKKLNLQIAEKAFDSVIPRDYIISQYPAPGEEVKEGRIIRVVISRGIMQTKVPNVENTNLREAQGILKREGWTVGRIAFVSSAYAEDGKVISQTPRPDSDVLPDSKINLLVSSGKEKYYFYMPDLIGKNIVETKKLIKSLALVEGEIKEEKTNDWENGTILEQNPQAGYMVSYGDPVDLKISVPGDSEVKAEKERQVFIVYSVPAGLVDRVIKVEVLDDRGSREELNRTVKPSERINLDVKVTGEAKMKIFLDGELIEEKEL